MSSPEQTPLHPLWLDFALQVHLSKTGACNQGDSQVMVIWSMVHERKHASCTAIKQVWQQAQVLAHRGDGQDLYKALRPSLESLGISSSVNVTMAVDQAAE